MTSGPPDDWTTPAWLKPFTKAELTWLAYVQDQRNRELRNTVTRLRAELEKATLHRGQAEQPEARQG